jgi:hypothetical protein
VCASRVSACERLIRRRGAARAAVRVWLVGGRALFLAPRSVPTGKRGFCGLAAATRACGEAESRSLLARLLLPCWQARVAVLEPGERRQRAGESEHDTAGMQGNSGSAGEAAAAEEPNAPDQAAASGHALTARAAVRLIAEMVLAALAATAANLVGDSVTAEQIKSARGAWHTSVFYGVDYVHREVVIMDQEPDSLSRRHRETNVASLLASFLLLCAFPLAYMQYLGASRRVCLAMLCAIALSYFTLELGYVVLGLQPFGAYQFVFGFMWLYAVLRVICPSGSAVPRQALRQMLVLCIGNFLTRNVARSRNVRGRVCIATIGLLTRHSGSRALRQLLCRAQRASRGGAVFSPSRRLLHDGRRVSRIATRQPRRRSPLRRLLSHHLGLAISHRA